MMHTRVTSDVLRAMKVGESREFKLPDAKAIFSGKAIAYRLQHDIGCKFTTAADYRDNILTITKTAI